MQFAVTELMSPRIMARDNLRLWHGIGTGMYALQWVCALVTLWKVGAGQGPVRYAGPS